MARLDGFELLMLDEVDSTNSEAMRSMDGLERPTWIVAERQTAGRGRNGRHWTTLPGNLAATLAIRLDEEPGSVALRTFVAALALRDAFISLAGNESSFTFKWPNDVLLNKGKVAGILLECASGSRSSKLAIGFGVNLAATPEPSGDGSLARPVSLAGETGVRVERMRFLQELASAYSRKEREFTRFGFASARAEWLERAEFLGETASFRLSDRIVNGVFRTVDSAGRAIVDSAEGRHEIAAADVAA